MNNAISVKALRESKVISDALTAQKIIGSDSAYGPKFDAATPYGFRVKLETPNVWVSVKKMYKKDLGYSIRIYVLNRAIDGSRVLGEVKYTAEVGLKSATEAAVKVLETLQDFDMERLDTLREDNSDFGEDNSDLGELYDLEEIEAESEALEIEAGQS